MRARRGDGMSELIDYEVGVYNRLVRDAVADGRSHRHLHDKWAEVHWQEIRAHDAEDARVRAAQRFPERAGYVVTEVLRAGG